MSRITPKLGFPMRLFVGSLAIIVLVGIVAAGLSWRLQNRLDEVRAKEFYVAEYVSRVMLFDEGLTNAARMVAATGDFTHKKRYDKLAPKLEALFNEIKNTLHRPQLLRFIEQADEANHKFVEMERHAFALAREGRLIEATGFLVNDKHSRLKAIYADGVKKAVAGQIDTIENDVRTLHNLTIGLQAATGIVLLLLLVACRFAFRAQGQWAQERLRSEAELRKSRDQLEMRVGERTADLHLRTKALSQEIGERKRANDKIEKQHSILDAALNNILQGVVMFDAAERLVVCNNEYLEMYRLSSDIVKPGCKLSEFLIHRAERNHLLLDPAQYRDEFLAKLTPQKSAKFIEVTGDGREISVVSRPMSNGGWIVTHEDITERRRAEARIAHMALYDPLTNLPNRRFFHEELETRLTQLSRDQMFAVFYLDLDGFKTVNDTLGHPFGDTLLCEMAERMSACLREGDTIARVGGDEFAILQGSIQQPEDVIALAARLIEAAGFPFEFDGHQVVSGVSIGITILPTDAADADQILKNADMALYRAKTGGRGSFHFFEPEMDKRLQARRAMELDLRKALATSEFELYYQPLVNVVTQEISGFEALIRWNHPQRGQVAPLDFIWLAEEMGLIVPIGEWVLRQACSEAVNWPPQIGIAVNLSPAQFKMRNLVQTVMIALAHSDLAAQRLELEITESLLLGDDKSTLETLRQLRKLGVRICMDDFGTGYSSLTYLRSFPFDKIKIDRSFVHDLAFNADSRAIIHAVTGLGASLGIITTGEGVETQEELEYLKQEGCTEAQGYFFSKPIPARDIPRLLSKQLAATKVVTLQFEGAELEQWLPAA